MLVISERDANLVESSSVENSERLRHLHKVRRVVEVEERLPKRGRLEQLLLPVALELTSSRVDARIDGRDELGSDHADLLIRFGRALLKKLHRLEEDRSGGGRPRKEHVLGRL